MKVSKKEFTTNIYKYLKPGSYTLTYRGTECLQVVISGIKSSNGVRSKDKVSTITHKVTTSIPKGVTTATDIPGVVTADGIQGTPRGVKDISKHGCGCRKTGTNLCSKHNRL